MVLIPTAVAAAATTTTTITTIAMAAMETAVIFHQAAIRTQMAVQMYQIHHHHQHQVTHAMAMAMAVAVVHLPLLQATYFHLFCPLCIRCFFVPIQLFLLAHQAMAIAMAVLSSSLEVKATAAIHLSLQLCYDLGTWNIYVHLLFVRK